MTTFSATMRADDVVHAPRRDITERIKTEPPDRITFTHDPGQRRENAGAEGEYRLDEVEGGTHLWIEITVNVDLPLPKFVRGAVERIMLHEMGRTGDEFAANMRRAVEG